MREKEGYRRHRRGWQLNERQRRVLDALVEGRTNAEIAVRLGITVDGAKWHVGELLAQTGLSDRQALARWWVEERDKRRQPAFLPGLIRWRRIGLAGSVVVAAAVLVTGGWLLWGRGSGREAPPASGRAGVLRRGLHFGRRHQTVEASVRGFPGRADGGVASPRFFSGRP